MWPYFKFVTCTEYSQSDFSSKISFFFISLLVVWGGCWFLRVFVCPHVDRAFQKDTRSRRYHFSGRFFTRAIILHYLRRSLSRAHNKATRARMLLYTRAPSFSLRVVLYERGAAGLTRAFFFAKDGQTDGTDEAFADSIAVTETGGTEIDRTRSRWT